MTDRKPARARKRAAQAAFARRVRDRAISGIAAIEAVLLRSTRTAALVECRCGNRGHCESCVATGRRQVVLRSSGKRIMTPAGLCELEYYDGCKILSLGCAPPE